MRTTDDLWMPVFHDISRTVLWVRAGPLDSEPYRSPGHCFHPCGHCAVCGCFDDWRLSTVPVSLNFLSNLLMLLVVHPLSGNYVVNCLALYLFNWYMFFILNVEWKIGRLRFNFKRSTFLRHAKFGLLISWGSVATYLRCIGQCYMTVVAHFMAFLAVKDFSICATFWPSYSWLNLTRFSGRSV